MKRILVLLSVVALMVVMLAMSVAPAFAAPPTFRCVNPNTGASVDVHPSQQHIAKRQGLTDCFKL
jgi:hypothetical protein